MTNILDFDIAKGFDYWLPIYAANRWANHGYYNTRIGEKELIATISRDPLTAQTQMRKVLHAMSGYDVVHCGDCWGSLREYESAGFERKRYQYWLERYRQLISGQIMVSSHESREIRVQLAGCLPFRDIDRSLAQERAREIIATTPAFDLGRSELAGDLRKYGEPDYNQKLYDYWLKSYRERQSPYAEIKLADAIETGHPLLAEKRVKEIFGPLSGYELDNCGHQLRKLFVQYVASEYKRKVVGFLITSFNNIGVESTRRRLLQFASESPQMANRISKKVSRKSLRFCPAFASQLKALAHPSGV